jgi:CheY-like chemotaxis protein
VADTGIGIPKERMGDLFKRFQQIDSSKSRRVGGSGLGLAIAKQLATMMHGDISASSSPAGSVFVVLLPISTTSTELVKSDSIRRRMKRSIGQSFNLLLAEDNVVNQKVACAMLKRLGHTVRVANNGQEALDMYPQADWDAVLLDVMMPVMDGIGNVQRSLCFHVSDAALEAAKRLRQIMDQSGSHIPIIALTASAMTDERELCLKAGMDDVITKPVSLDRLQVTLMNWCTNMIRSGSNDKKLLIPEC